MIRELREELEALKKGGGGGGGGGMSEEMKGEMEEQKKLLEQMQREKDEFEQKLAEQQAQFAKKKQEQEKTDNFPHLININSDPTMTGKVKKGFNDGENVVGKQTKDWTPDIIISGVGIAARHCVLQFDEAYRTTKVCPNEEDPEKHPVKVNGEPVVAEPRGLNHGDRILVGTHHYYMYIDPAINPDETYEWEAAMKEANADSLKMLGQDNGELEKIKAEAEAMR